MPQTAQPTPTQKTASPSFILMRDEGVYVHLATVPSQDALRQFVDRIFDNGSYFIGLEYATFLALLYGNAPLASIGNGKEEVKISGSIALFPMDRLGLYKGLKIERQADRAEYLFEPVYLEVTRSEPVHGLPDKEGVSPIIKYRTITEQIPAQLDFDEFVAAAWLNGLRFGIDEKAVREALRSKKAGRIPVAFQRPPTDSRDAEIREESDRLHQDRSPLVLPNGRVDMRKARNRFPQVTKETVLLRKIPRALGEPGYRVTGTVIEPRPPKDVHLHKLAGEGTRIDHTAAGEVLVAHQDGFISVDSHSGLVRISTKIENREGISVKATGGDLSLDVDDFTEYGEVQEGRVVEGKNLTFHASVFGTAISRNGTILIHGNLSSGRALATEGCITIKGKAINSRVEAIGGEIHIETAEECSLIGKKITVTKAINCEIVADHLEARSVEGCAIAGRAIRIDDSDLRKFNETVISLVLPDIPALDRQIVETRDKLAQVQQDIKVKLQRLMDSQSNEGFANYLLLKEKLEAGTVRLTEEQREGWEKLVARYAPLLQTTDDLTQKREALKTEIQALETERSACCTTEHCRVAHVRGDTLVQKLVSGTGLSAFYKLSGQALKVALRQIREKRDQVFSGSTGSLDYAASAVLEPSAKPE